MKYLNQQQKEKYILSKALVTTVLTLVVVAVILVNVFTHVLLVVRYNGDGMEPALRSGQTLILRKTQSVEEGDIIAFYYNNQILIRRMICSGEKQIQIQQDGTVYINNQEIEEPYLTAKSLGQCNIVFPYYVKPGCVFVMGDNRTEAMDSRLTEIGTIPTERIIGKVLWTF